MTDRTWTSKLFSLLFSGGLLFALCAACTVEDGERASTGECPAGEVCSDATPDGLTFYGPLPGDDMRESRFLRRLAMGGSSWLGFAGEGALRDAEVDSSAPWFVRVAEDTSEEGIGDVRVRLEALAEGETLIRVVDSNGALHDRITLRVERIARVEATVPYSADERLFAGARDSIVFQLLGENGDRLVDEGMTITSDTEFEPVSWDCVDLEVPDQDEVEFLLEAGHRRWSVRLPVSR